VAEKEKSDVRVKPKAVPIPGMEQLPKRLQEKMDVDRERREAERDIAFCDGTYTVADVRKWKKLGLDRPDFVPTSDWEITEMNPLRGVICHLAAYAMDHADIARVTGAHPSYISEIVSSQVGEAEIRRVQDLVWGRDFKSLMNQIAPLAINEAMRTMLDPKTKGSTKIAAAFGFMDRAPGIGKPVQNVEVGGNLILSVFRKLDALDANEGKPPIEVEAQVESSDPLTEAQTPPTVEETGDEVDQWVKENL